MNIVHDLFFPSYVWYADLERNDKKLLKDIKKISKNENSENKSGVNTYQSSRDLYLKNEFKILCDDIMVMAKGIVEKYFESSGILFFESMWFNINYKHGFNIEHVHSKSFLTGVYYVDANKDSGDLIFHDVEKKAMTDYYLEYNRLNYQKVPYKPKNRRMFLFPSWLTHSVLPNKKNEERISISFDIGLKRS
jgi:uncharacterized protein (TIGR02466 family)